MPPNHPRVAIVVTVKDEEDNVADLIESMLAQTRPADEIVIHDCDSTDRTPEIVRSYIDRGAPIRLVGGGHNIPQGRNRAVAAAEAEILASTDAGLTLDPRWLEAITAPFFGPGGEEIAFVKGVFRPAPRTFFEWLLGTLMYPAPEDLRPDRYYAPGQSLAFRREPWAAVGGFPEWADHCEDILFQRALEARGFRGAFAPEAVIYFRPRSSPAAFFRQYFNYARGDGLGGLWPERHGIRYGSYLAGALLAALGLRGRPWAWGLLAAGSGAYLSWPYRRLLRRLGERPWPERLLAILLTPLLRILGDVAKMAGYPVGLAARRRRGRTGGKAVGAPPSGRPAQPAEGGGEKAC